MANKKSRFPHIPNFFTPPGPHDPIGNIAATGANIIINHGLNKLSREAAKLMGLSGASIEDTIALNRSRVSLARQETELAKVKALSDRQIRLMDIRIAEKELDIQRRKQALENTLEQKEQLAILTNTEVVSGALEVAATPEGLIGSTEESEGYFLWLDSFQRGKVLLILGRRGSGKTSLAAKIGEYMMATYKMPIYWIGLPEQARGLLPSWIKLVDSPEQCPLGCFMIIDEAGIQYLSLAFNTDRNRLIRALLQICRHRHCSLIFAVQSSRDVENSIVRQADTIIFKEPGLNQPETERTDIRAIAKKAALVFKEMPKDKRREAAYVYDNDFQGIITSTVPSFWSETLSNVYGHFDLTAIEHQVQRSIKLRQTVVEETKLLSEASLDKEILELKQQGYGIEKIAKMLDCTTYRVRKCLDGLE